MLNFINDSHLSEQCHLEGQPGLPLLLLLLRVSLHHLLLGHHLDGHHGPVTEPPRPVHRAEAAGAEDAEQLVLLVEGARPGVGGPGPAPLPLLAAEPRSLAPGPRAQAEQLAQLELDDHCVCC